MRISDASPYDVIIAGAGPVGLFLACELRLHGCSVLVLEKSADPSSPMKVLPFGLRGLSVPTIESLDRRGLLDSLKSRMVGAGTPGTAHWAGQKRITGGHFAGIQFFSDQVETSQWPWRLPGMVASMAVDMAGLETVLAERALASGVEIRRGKPVDAIEASAGGIVVEAAGERFYGRWLVGCDGGRSTVRKAAGMAFTGTDPEFTGYSVEIELADASLLRPGRHYTDTGMYTFSPPGTVAMVDFDGGAFHRSEPTLAHVQAVLRRISGVAIDVIALRLAATWTDRAHQADMYRSGRILLAGDAAHIHSPLGGQGLNLGLGDAMNLGWKLAAVIRGEAQDELLDSYHAERHPVGADVLDWSRAQVALMRPDRRSRALLPILRDMVATRDGATYMAGRVWGVTTRYDLGNAHSMVGRSAPDFRFEDGSSLNERLRSGAGLIVDFAGEQGLASLAAPRSRSLGYVSLDVEDRLGISAAIVRPDGIVAWACQGSADRDDAAQAVSRWFGWPEADRQ